MREILFRGKCVDDGMWVEGSLIQTLVEESRENNVVKMRPACFIRFFDGSLCYEVEEDTVGQYTGLKDRNGKKIFEGDILREPPIDDWEKRNYAGFEVFYHDNDACDQHVGWQMNRLHFYGALCGADIYPRSFRPAWTNKMEDIGNIHDNAEVLRNEKRRTD